jgi:hypothetical protein
LTIITLWVFSYSIGHPHCSKRYRDRIYLPPIAHVLNFASIRIITLKDLQLCSFVLDCWSVDVYRLVCMGHITSFLNSFWVRITFPFISIFTSIIIAMPYSSGLSYFYLRSCCYSFSGTTLLSIAFCVLFHPVTIFFFYPIFWCPSSFYHCGFVFSLRAISTAFFYFYVICLII